MPMPAALQMQLLQQQMMGGGMGSYDGFDDDMYDMIDPTLLSTWIDGYGHGQYSGHLQGVVQTTQYYHMLQHLQQVQMARQMQQMMGYHGHSHGVRYPRKRDYRRGMFRGGMGMGMRGMIGGGVGGYAGFGGGGRAMMGSPFGVDPMRSNQLALMNSPWRGG